MIVNVSSNFNNEVYTFLFSFEIETVYFIKKKKSYQLKLQHQNMEKHHPSTQKNLWVCDMFIITSKIVIYIITFYHHTYEKLMFLKVFVRIFASPIRWLNDAKEFSLFRNELMTLQKTWLVSTHFFQGCTENGRNNH